MSPLAACKSTTTEQQFKEDAALSPYDGLKYTVFLFFDNSTTQSSILNYDNPTLICDKEVEIVRYTTIDTLINFNYTLKKPIEVKIIEDISGVIGDIEELELYSFGNNEFEVLRELNEELTVLFEDLIEIEDKNLGDFPKKWKSILNRYIKKVDED
jgi:hypothetical protein